MRERDHDALPMISRPEAPGCCAFGFPLPARFVTLHAKIGEVDRRPRFFGAWAQWLSPRSDDGEHSGLSLSRQALMVLSSYLSDKWRLRSSLVQTVRI